MMQLIQLVDQIETDCDLVPKTVGQYRLAAEKFGEFLGKPATAADLSVENLNAFIKHLQKSLTNTTAGNYRRVICILWNKLSETLGIPEYPIRRLRKPKPTYRPVFAPTLSEFAVLIKACESLDGTLNTGIKASDHCRAVLMVGYDTGLRPSDSLRLGWSQFDKNQRCFALIQHKTKKPHVVFIAEETHQAIAKIRTDSENVFSIGYSGTRKYMDKLYLIAAPMGYEKRKGQNFGVMRKTHATEIACEKGVAAAAESLSHSSPRITELFYLDQRTRRQFQVPKRPAI